MRPSKWRVGWEQWPVTYHYITLHYITLHYRHFKRHLHLKWPVVHQQLHVIRNTAHRPSTQASYTASRVRQKRKISCAAAQIAATQIAATLTISFPRWRHTSLTSYWGQQRIYSMVFLGGFLVWLLMFSLKGPNHVFLFFRLAELESDINIQFE